MPPSPSFENVDLDAEGTQKEPTHDPQRPAPARCRPSQQRAPGRGHHQAARIHPVVDVRPPRALAAVPGPVVCESAGLHPLDAPLPRVPDGRGRRLRDHPPPRGRLRNRGHPGAPVVPDAPGRHHRSRRRHRHRGAPTGCDLPVPPDGGADYHHRSLSVRPRPAPERQPDGSAGPGLDGRRGRRVSARPPPHPESGLPSDRPHHPGRPATDLPHAGPHAHGPRCAPRRIST